MCIAGMKTANRIHNILIMKPGAIGDLLQLTPVIRALSDRYPDAGISLLVGSFASAGLFRHNPRVRETIILDTRRGQRSFLSFIKLWLRLRKKKYDLIVNFQRSNVRTWLLATASFPCPVLVYHKARGRVVHAVVNYLEAIAPLGVSTSDLRLELTPGPEDRAAADVLCAPLRAGKDPVVALNPGASHPVNRWGTDRFAELADMLAERISAKVIIIGGSDDVPLAEEIAARARTGPLLLAGKTELLQLGAVLEKCSLLVTGDTGPMHVAAAVGTKVLALFGAADPLRTGPVGSGHRVIQARDVACIPCRSRSCANPAYLECMKKITAQEVFDAAAGMVKATGRI